MNGIIIIDKPEGLTSHDVVARLRRILKTKKIGHTGTLDPFATGVLVMLIGKATRLAQFLDKDEKSYEARIRFGFETDTGDRTGLRTAECEMPNEEISEHLKEIDWNEVFEEFRGEIEQVPPMYSAKKIEGQKLYELARKGIEIERKPVAVQISKLNLLEEEIRNPKPAIRIQVACSAGTYIRTLAEDIGRRIGVPSHLSELRRIEAGRFEISRAISIEKLDAITQAEKLDEILVSMSKAISHLPGKTLDERNLEKIKHGLKIDADFKDKHVRDVRLVDSDDNLAAIGSYDDTLRQIQPRIVFLNH